MTEESKKKPGRPKKKLNNINISNTGLAAAPIYSDDYVELTYANPLLFKKIFSLYKSFAVNNIDIYFTATEIQLISKDHIGKTDIYTTIYGSQLNHYYCKEPIKIRILHQHIENILRTIDRNHYQITIFLKDNYRSILYMIIKDLQYNNEDQYEINVINSANTPTDTSLQPLHNDTNYPLQFTFPFKHFKKKMNDIRILSPSLSITKSFSGPLEFTFGEIHRQISYTGIYKDFKIINLEHKLEESDIISISFNIDYIKPLSTSNIGEQITIRIDKKDYISFTTYIDIKEYAHACMIKVFTQTNKLS
ncbi:MAG: hypothetical protein ACYCPT_08345 [Acidimicrobiales bacterium]